MGLRNAYLSGRVRRALKLEKTYVPCFVEVTPIVGLPEHAVFAARRQQERIQPSSQLPFQAQQGFTVNAVLVAVVGLGFKQTFNIKRANLHAVHGQGAHMVLQAFIGLPVGGKEQVDQQLVGYPDLFRLTSRWREPLDIQLFAGVQKRQGLYIACIEEIAYINGFINKEQLLKIAEPLMKTEYGKYLMQIADENNKSK